VIVQVTTRGGRVMRARLISYGDVLCVVQRFGVRFSVIREAVRGEC
jgi:hypothetical protein